MLFIYIKKIINKQTILFKKSISRHLYLYSVTLEHCDFIPYVDALPFETGSQTDSVVKTPG